MIKQLVILLLLSAGFGLGLNLVSPNAIPYFGTYRSLSNGDGPIVPPDAAAGDPPFIGLDVANLEFNDGRAIFVDAREESEFVCGTIPGSINIPFDYLPDGDLANYFDSCLAGALENTVIITYCSGEECDLSLHLARNMQAFGYTNLTIFFGGSREWEKAGLEMERRVECAD